MNRYKNIRKALICIFFLWLFGGCAHRSFYTQVSSPSLHMLGMSVNAGKMTVFFTVSNPTSKRLHFNIRCTLGLSDLETGEIIVAPRSDKDESLSFISQSSFKLRCEMNSLNN